MITNSDGAIIAVGQNRMLDPPGGPGPLAGTLMAHAEMNALAALPSGEYRGHTLYTTYEPCFMCAATIIGTYHIPKVAFAACDPCWDGLFDAFRRHPAIAADYQSRSTWAAPTAPWLMSCTSPGFSGTCLDRTRHTSISPRPTWRSRRASWSRARSSTWNTMVRAPRTLPTHCGPTYAGCPAPTPH